MPAIAHAIFDNPVSPSADSRFVADLAGKRLEYNGVSGIRPVDKLPGYGGVHNVFEDRRPIRLAMFRSADAKSFDWTDMTLKPLRRRLQP